MLAWLVLGSSVALGSPVGSATDVAEAPASVDQAAAEPEPTEAERWPVLFPGQCVPGDPNFDLEVLYHDYRFDEGLKLANERLASSSPTADLYWMKTRFMYEVGEKHDRADKSIDKIAWYQEMLDTVEAGLALAPNDRHLLFARGVAMGRLGTTRGVLSSLFMAKDVESAWLTVANDPSFRYASLGGHEILPCDAYHALGIYYRLVPDYWIVQMIAGTRGSLDKSLAWNQKAVQCKPRDVANWKELGATQLCLGQKKKDPALLQEGVASLERGAALPAANQRQRIDREHCRAMIADPSLACGYSRDGQQDLDEKKLEAQRK
jgi:hypothetical protein